MLSLVTTVLYITPKTAQWASAYLIIDVNILIHAFKRHIIYSPASTLALFALSDSALVLAQQLFVVFPPK